MKLTKQEAKKETTKIILGLVARNMENGSTYKQAKDQAFNRLEKDYPELLNIFTA